MALRRSFTAVNGCSQGYADAIDVLDSHEATKRMRVAAEELGTHQWHLGASQH
jgi:hypothetical protein